ncbi:quinoprotein glucose dehydrogenase [Myxococcaceae bacterium]|jgi:quinoprotein glucose dehydrogenase|nr:quinoprotein glucose dehydrogenase [Myxococcaceae bacterium]
MRSPALAPLLVLVLGGLPAAASVDDSDWPSYGRDAGGSRYSPLADLTPENVERLEVAWTFRTGELDEARSAKWKSATFEATPILAGGNLVFCSGQQRIFALDPETGRERWRADVARARGVKRADAACRGVASWLDPAAEPGAACRLRILTATLDAELIALDAATGARCAGFGKGGSVDLDRGIAHTERGHYGVTSPPVVIGELVFVGSAVGDNQRTDDSSGVVRAYDVRTGEYRFGWDPIPKNPEDPAFATWEDGSALRTGAANAWAQLSADPDRGLVFVPTGSASPDFFGGERRGENRWANSVVALRAKDGSLAWGFQLVHHDLWDYDAPAQPTLVTVNRGSQKIAAVVQATKMGHLFVLDRESGKPLFPVEERPVPQSDVPGEATSPTQPFPVKPDPLVPQRLRPEDAFGITPLDRASCRKKIASYRSEGIFTPPSLEGSIIFPGNAGGSNWGSVAFDPKSGLLYANTSRVAHVVKLIPRDELDAAREANPGKEISPMRGTPFGMMRDVLLSPLMIPCNPPPWGALAAIDLATGERRFESVLGTTRDLAPVPIPIAWGTPNQGGPIVTAGGLVFIGAAMDDFLRAFDASTGEEIWKGRLPAGGQATPMTYRAGGRQFVVIAAGGHGRMTTTLGDSVVAFAPSKP